jgi:hypothetical protein
MFPAKIKKGMARRVKLSNPDAIFCETTAIEESNGNKIKIDASEDIPIEKDMGTPNTNKRKKLPNRTKATNHSISYPYFL